MSNSNIEDKRNFLPAYNYIFCSIAKENFGEPNAAFLPGEFNDSGMLLQLFDLREALIQKKIVKLCAKGICMYPCVRPGDILHIVYKKSKEIAIGDIAVYRRGNSLFGHRVIGRGYQKEASYIVTRPDTVTGSGSGYIFDKDIAGIVTSIEREGLILGPEKVHCSLIHKIYLKFWTILFEIKNRLIKSFIYPITLMQYCLIYRKISKLLFFRINKNINFSLSVPLEGNTKLQFKKIVSFEELRHLKNDFNGRLEWEVVLNAGCQRLGSLVFANRFKEGGLAECWLTQIRIKNAYHGSIIEERIFKKADELLAKLGVDCVLISVAKKDHPNRAIIAGLGFKSRLKDHSLAGGSLVLERMIKI